MAARRPTGLHVVVPAEQFAIDPVTGVARIPVVIRSEDNVVLAGCPAPPVLVLQLWAGDQWHNHYLVNRPCPQRAWADSVLRIFNNDSALMSMDVTMPGVYRVALASGHRGTPVWVPGQSFTVR